MVLQGLPCDTNGNTLPPGTLPALQPLPDTPWAPFVNGVQFKTADFLFQCAKMSAGNIDDLFDLWAESMENSYDSPPFESHEHVYETIDATHYGDALWKCFTVSYSGEASQPCPTWQKDIWEVFYRDPDVVLSQMLGNPDFHGQFDYALYVHLDKGGSQIWSDFMSGNFAFRQSV